MQKRKKAEVNHVCSRCKYIRKVPSLFPDFEVIECSNGCYKTLRIIPSGGEKLILSGKHHRGGVR